MLLAEIGTKAEKTTYQTKEHSLQDVGKPNSSLTYTRGRLYDESSVIQNESNNCIIEITGYLSLSEKFNLWYTYGQPKTDLYYCVEKGAIVSKDKLDLDNGYIWSIGWISDTGYVVVYVDMLMLLNEYHNINNTKKIIDNGNEQLIHSVNCE